MSFTKIIMSVFIGFCGVLVISVIAANIVKWYEVEEKCIGNYQPCGGRSMKPCCRQRKLEGSCDIPEDFVCDYFFAGICKPLSKIRNLDGYIKLTKNLSSTDIRERTILYRDILGLSRMDSILSYVAYFWGGCLLFLVFVILVFHMRMAAKYAPNPTNDIPPWL